VIAYRCLRVSDGSCAAHVLLISVSAPYMKTGIGKMMLAAMKPVCLKKAKYGYVIAETMKKVEWWKKTLIVQPVAHSLFLSMFLLFGDEPAKQCERRCSPRFGGPTM